MSFIEMIDRINRLHKLITQKRTGTPTELANRLGISRAGLYNLMEDLKSYNAPIKYSRSRETFYYTEDFDVNIQVSLKLINNEPELKNINGGSKIFSSVHFFRRKDANFTLNKMIV